MGFTSLVSKSVIGVFFAILVSILLYNDLIQTSKQLKVEPIKERFINKSPTELAEGLANAVKFKTISFQGNYNLYDV